MHSCLLFQTYVNKINDSEPKEKIGKILKPEANVLKNKLVQQITTQ